MSCGRKSWIFIGVRDIISKNKSSVTNAKGYFEQGSYMVTYPLLEL